MAGAITQVIALAVLAATVGLGAGGWAAGLAGGVVGYRALNRALNRAGRGGLGPADWVTMARAMLVGCVAALVADAFWRPAPLTVLVGIACAALVLDAVDGQVARRTGTASALGARFDMEVDAFLLLILSVHVARSMGFWVLAIGAMRYAFVIAGWLLPWLRGTLPPRYWRKVVAATQGVVLVVAVGYPGPLAVVAVAAALALLLESFGRDVAWLYQRHRHRSGVVRQSALGDDIARIPLPARKR